MKLIILLLLLPFIQLSAAEISGRYHTTYQKMILTQDGDEVYGSYQSHKGVLKGVLKGNTLTGTWQENTQKGLFSFQFTSDFSKFTGKWGYNDAPPSSNWNGTREKPCSPMALGIYQVNNQKMILIQNGKQIRGRYTGGNITGKIKNQLFTGKWSDQNSSGAVSATFSPDFKTFTGKWSTQKGEKPWGGDRVIPDKKNASGLYESSYGTLVILQNGTNLIGLYRSRDGSLTGKVDGNQFTGVWHEARSKSSGKAMFIFTPNFAQFSGKWGNGQAAPTMTWNGTTFYLQKPQKKERAVLKEINTLNQPAGTDSAPDDDDGPPEDW